MRLTILLVEDDAKSSEAMKAGIEAGAADRRVLVARNEYEAGTFIDGQPLDLIITDINLEESGGTAIGGIRVMEKERGRGGNTPIIVVTGYAKSEIPSGESARTVCITVQDRAEELGATLVIRRNRNTRDEIVSAVNGMFPESLKHHSKEGTDGHITLLHLSDLHMSASSDPEGLVGPLVADLKDEEEGLGIKRLDYLVVSGDLTDCATPRAFIAAQTFLSRLQSKMGLQAEHCVVVPGNHDVDWNTEVYDARRKREFPNPPPEGTYSEEGNLYLVRNDERYPKRFENFSNHLYEPLFGFRYPLESEEQGQPFSFPEDRLQILAFNSAWQIDEVFPNRSGIQERMLARTLAEADNQLGADQRPWYRVAVWHHPVTGRQAMQNDAFLQQLRRAGTIACLHGHVHDDTAELVGYLHPTRRLHIIGAGSFGAAARDRPPNVPRLYNVLKIGREPDAQWIEVHTRCLRKEGGAWGPWTVWPGENGSFRAWYRIDRNPRSNNHAR
jgi:CheY-like chemotaxis protein